MEKRGARRPADCCLRPKKGWRLTKAWMRLRGLRRLGVYNRNGPFLILSLGSTPCHRLD